jgi:hypothetical protein
MYSPHCVAHSSLTHSLTHSHSLIHPPTHQLTFIHRTVTLTHSLATHSLSHMDVHLVKVHPGKASGFEWPTACVRRVPAAGGKVRLLPLRRVLVRGNELLPRRLVRLPRVTALKCTIEHTHITHTHALSNTHTDTDRLTHCRPHTLTRTHASTLVPSLARKSPRARFAPQLDTSMVYGSLFCETVSELHFHKMIRRH